MTSMSWETLAPEGAFRDLTFDAMEACRKAPDILNAKAPEMLYANFGGEELRLRAVDTGDDTLAWLQRARVEWKRLREERGATLKPRVRKRGRPRLDRNRDRSGRIRSDRKRERRRERKGERKRERSESSRSKSSKSKAKAKAKAPAAKGVVEIETVQPEPMVEETTQESQESPPIVEYYTEPPEIQMAARRKRMFHESDSFMIFEDTPLYRSETTFEPAEHFEFEEEGLPRFEAYLMSPLMFLLDFLWRFESLLQLSHEVSCLGDFASFARALCVPDDNCFDAIFDALLGALEKTRKKAATVSAESKGGKQLSRSMRVSKQLCDYLARRRDADCNDIGFLSAEVSTQSGDTRLLSHLVNDVQHRILLDDKTLRDLHFTERIALLEMLANDALQRSAFRKIQDAELKVATSLQQETAAFVAEVRKSVTSRLQRSTIAADALAGALTAALRKTHSLVHSQEVLDSFHSFILEDVSHRRVAWLRDNCMPEWRKQLRHFGSDAHERQYFGLKDFLFVNCPDGTWHWGNGRRGVPKVLSALDMRVAQHLDLKVALIAFYGHDRYRR